MSYINAGFPVHLRCHSVSPLPSFQYVPCVTLSEDTGSSLHVVPSSSPLQGGYTPLHEAAVKGHSAMIPLLLADPRVNPNAQNTVCGHSRGVMTACAWVHGGGFVFRLFVLIMCHGCFSWVCDLLPFVCACACLSV